MHPNCRCSVAAYEDDEEYEAWLDYLDNGGTTAEWNASGLRAWKKAQKGLGNSRKSDNIKAGALHGAYNSQNDPDGEKRDAHADMYYTSMRNRKPENAIRSIARGAEVSVEIAEKMFKHLFVNKHELDRGYTYFDSDYNIAQSVQRLIEGKGACEHDKILVMHEALEHDLMKNGKLSYDKAHEEANKKYNYQKALQAWLKEHGGE